MKKLILLLLISSFALATGFPYSYYKIKNRQKQRIEFVNILNPLIEKANKKTIIERNFIKGFFQRALNSDFRLIPPKDLKMLLKLSKKYKIKYLFSKKQYLYKIDAVPVSLALTQGALESAWGKSRFVREANNIFGHWTWGDYGLVPLNREEGKTHKIRIFRTLQSSVDAYILNLNTHSAYSDFRKIRFKRREEGYNLSGLDAATTMINYSQIGIKYVRILQKMMRDYNFLYYDKL